MNDFYNSSPALKHYLYAAITVIKQHFLCIRPLIFQTTKTTKQQPRQQFFNAFAIHPLTQPREKEDNK